MASKFVVKKGPTGKFRFLLVARNGQIIATSEAYNSKASCLNGVRAVKETAGDAEVEDQTTRAWADEQARTKAATKTAAQAAKKTIAKATSKTGAPKKSTTATTKRTGATR